MKTLYIFYSIYLLCFAVCSSTNSCPNQWVSNSDSCYKFITFPQYTHGEAFQSCTREGARLLKIDDLVEYEFISTMLNEVGIDRSIKWYTAGELDANNIGKYFWNGYPIGHRNFTLKLLQHFIDKLPIKGNMDDWDIARRYIVLGSHQSTWGFYFVKSDEKLYTICEADKSVVDKKMIRIRTYEYNQIDAENTLRGPIITQDPKNQLFLPAILNSNKVTFICKFVGSPFPTVKWYFLETTNRGVLRRQIKPLEFTDGSVSQTGGILIIHKPDNRFAHKIQCEVTNKFGSVLSRVVQIIQGKLDSYQTDPKQTVYKKTNVGFVLDCEPPSHSPKDSLLFTFVTRRISEGIEVEEPIQPSRTNIFLSQNLGLIGFSAAMPMDTGSYLCMINWKGVVSSGTSYNSPEMPVVISRDSAIYSTPMIHDKFPNMRPSQPKLGDTVVLECFGYGEMKQNPLTYIWKLNGEPLPKSAKVSDYTRRVTIENIQFENEGDYSCILMTSAGKKSDSKIIRMILEAEPTFINKPTSQYVDVDGVATFNCMAMGKPDITLKWYRNSDLLTDWLAQNAGEAGRYKIINNKNNIQLNISNVKSADSAMFGCVIENKFGAVTSYAELKTFLFAPNFNKYPVTNAEGMIGEPVILPCQPEGAPLPSISWKFNGNPLTFSRIEVDPSDGTEKCKAEFCIYPNNNLFIPKLSESNRGRFTCVAENSLGKAESTGFLDVVKNLNPLLKPVGRKILVNTNVVLPCQADSTASMDINYDWYFENVQIKFDRLDKDARRYDASQFDRPYNEHFGYMMINGIQFYDEGTYTCRITTPVSIRKESAFYKVIGPPGGSGGVSIIEQANDTFQVEWTNGDSRGYEIIKYRLEVRQINATWRSFEEFSSKDVTKIKKNVKLFRISRTFSGLPAFTTFQLRVIAFNELGMGDASSPSPAFRTKARPPSKRPINVTGGGGRIYTLVVRWEKLAKLHENGPKFSYEVRMREKKEDEWETKTNLIKNFDDDKGVDMYRQMTITLSDKRFNKPYDVQVRAINEEGKGPWTDTVIIYSAPSLPKNAPRNVEASSYNSTALSVTWEQPPVIPEEGKILGYHIVYWLKHYDCKEIQAYADRLRTSQRLSLYNLTELEGIIIGLEADAYYCVGVQAINAAGDGPESSFFDQSTFKKAPQNFPTMVVLNSTGTPGEIKVRWNGVQVNSDEESLNGYRVRYWLSGAPVKTARDIDAGMNMEAVISGIEYSRRYNVRVYAYSRGGVGKLSNPMVHFSLIRRQSCIRDKVVPGVDVQYVYICGCRRLVLSSLTILLTTVATVLLQY